MEEAPGGYVGVNLMAAILKEDFTDLARVALEEGVSFVVQGAGISRDVVRWCREAGTPFDCVILDLTIRGGMGGVETVARLRELDPAVKAVATSGYSDDATLANFREQGFTAFLKKPYSAKELQATLDALLA
jgi:CheY-like chemotaxis protein